MALTDLVEFDDRWELVRLLGRKVDRIEFGVGDLELFFDHESGDEPTHSPWRASIGSSPTLEPPDLVGDLLHQPVSAATVWLDGRLEFRFENGARIEVSPRPDVEAWELGGPDGLLIVCTPGGGEPALWPGGEDQVTYTFDPEV